VAVDDATGYRYYDLDQVAQAELIRRLRATEMPVEAVRAFLVADPAGRRRRLEEHVAALEGRLTGLRAAAAEIVAALEQTGGAGPACRLPGATLADAVGQIVFAADQDGARPELAGVLVEVKDGSLRLVATDSYRLAVRDVLPTWSGDQPLRALVAAGQLGKDVETVRDWPECELRPDGQGGLVLASAAEQRLLPGLAGKFPDYEHVLIGSGIVSRGIADRRRLARAVTDAGSGPVVLSGVPEGLRISGDATETVVPCSWDRPGTAVTLNGTFLADAVGVSVGPDVVIELTDRLRPVVLRSADTGTLGVWIMPIRTNTP